MKIDELRASRLWHEQQRYNDLRLWGRWISGKDLPEYSCTKDIFDMEVEVSALLSRLDNRRPAHDSITFEHVLDLFQLVLQTHAKRRAKLQGRWPEWAFSWVYLPSAQKGATRLRIYATLAVMAVRQWLPIAIPSRHLEIVIRHVAMEA